MRMMSELAAKHPKEYEDSLKWNFNRRKQWVVSKIFECGILFDANRLQSSRRAQKVGQWSVRAYGAFGSPKYWLRFDEVVE